jgi:hypothetical protein
MATYPVTTVAESSGIAGRSRDNFTGRFKIEFMEEWDKHVHTEAKLPSMIAKKKGTMGGFESLGSVVTSLPQSAGIGLFEGSTLPTPRVGSQLNPVLHARDVYTRLRWTGHVERAARKGDKVAWMAPRRQDIEHANEQFKLNWAMMLYMGPYAPRAVVQSRSSQDLTLYGRNSRTSLVDDFFKLGSHYLRVNQSIDYVNASTGSVQLTASVNSNVEGVINNIDTSNPDAPIVSVTGTFNAGAVPADETILVPYGSRRTTPSTNVTNYSNMNGLSQLVLDSSIYTHVFDLARSTNPTLSGIRSRDSSGVQRAFNEDLIALSIDRIADEGRGDAPTRLLMDRSIRREYVKESKGDRRFEPVQTEKGYKAKLVFHAGDTSIPLEVDWLCPNGMMFVLMEEDFGYLEQSPMTTFPERFVADQDANEIIIHKSGNVFCTAPYCHGSIEDIQHNVRDLTS